MRNAAGNRTNRLTRIAHTNLGGTNLYSASKTAGGVTRDYHYDRENRLARMSEGEEDIFSAAYDYRCRRLEKTENGDTVSYLYDGGVSVQEYDVEGSLTTYLVRAGGYGGGIGREFFPYNATGTSSALTSDAGTVTHTSCYTAWGTKTATVGTTDNVRKFSMKERSEVLGIDYFGFRYYDPELGRFITRDPSGYPDGPNNYLYCLNSPVNKIDPLGLVIETLWDAANAALGFTMAVQNVRAGNYGDAIIDTMGAVLDTITIFVPCVPGGASTGIRVLRGAEKVNEAAKVVDKANDTTKVVDKGTDASTPLLQVDNVKGTPKGVDNLSQGAAEAKNVPNPHGKKGGPEH